MNIPTITGLIRRRILLNYRVHAEVVQKILPERFRPKLVQGKAVAGICLIKLEDIRPKGFPKFLALSSENSAHRIAVEWENDQGKTCEGVFVPRRDTSSTLNALAGGRIFPGVHHRSDFEVEDQAGEISMQVTNRNSREPLVDFKAEETEDFPQESVFASLQESSDFFEAGCIGYSSRPNSCKLDGLLLRVTDWRVSPLAVKQVSSSYFDDEKIFPKGSIHFDHALLMRNISHQWHSEPMMVSSIPSVA